MNLFKASLAGLLSLMVLGCGEAPTSLLLEKEESTTRQAVIYGKDSVAEALGNSNPNYASTVALVKKESWENYVKGLSDTLEEAYGGMEVFNWKSQEAVAFCSGVLVSKNKVLTANHCIPSLEACRDSLVVFGYEGEGASKKARAVKCSALVSKSASKLDYAVIQLAEEMSDIELPEVEQKSSLAVGEELYMLGHPLGALRKISTGRVRAEAQNGIIIATLDSFEGNSGSPVFSAKTNKLIGISVAGESSFVASEDIESGRESIRFCGDDECAGESIVDIKKILADIQK